LKFLCSLFQPVRPEETVAHSYFLDGRADTLGGLVGFGKSTIEMDVIGRLALDGLMEAVSIVVKEIFGQKSVETFFA
jgi:hypothetical protein